MDFKTFFFYFVCSNVIIELGEIVIISIITLLKKP